MHAAGNRLPASAMNFTFGTVQTVLSMNARRAVLVKVTLDALGKHAAPFQSPIPPPPARTGAAFVGELLPFTVTAPEYVLSAVWRLAHPGPIASLPDPDTGPFRLNTVLETPGEVPA